MAGSTDESGKSYNRVFVLGGKDCSKDEFKTTFGTFGEVKDIWMVEDRKTGEFKGVTYITFSKASEAALAMEEMNGKTMGSSPKTMKVLMASDKREGNVRDPNESERMMRLFIMVPKSMSETQIKENFEEYGKVEFVRLLKDRKSGESKGLAFVKFFRAYHCALALEQCDQTFKAVFAAPKDSNTNSRQSVPDKWSNDYDNFGPSHGGGRDFGYSGGMGGGSSGGGGGGGGGFRESSYPSMPLRPSLLGSNPGMGPAAPSSPMADLMRSYSNSGPTSLEVMAAPGVTRDQLHALLDMTPGLDYCEVDRESGVAYVQYKQPQCAAYVKEKLALLEYPPGYRIAVRYPQNSSPSFGNSSGIEEAVGSLNASLQSIDGNNVQGSLGTIVESIKKATDLLQKAGLPGVSNNGMGGNERVRYCNVPLPFTKPLAHRDSKTAQRLFIVSQPEAFPGKYLQDVLSRFGELIDAFFMPGKNFGYAKFSSESAAEEAIKVLHGQTVCDQRLKVMKADPPKHDEEQGAKRARIY